MKPTREPATRNRQTYFVTAKTWQGQPLFRYARWAELFVNVLFHYRSEQYLLHEFVVMPDHFHILITPNAALERSIQFIKGGFSRRATVDLQSRRPVWQRGFSDHRIRDASDYGVHKAYIDRNPIKAGLANSERYPYGSATGSFELDPFPQGLKPL